MPSKYLLVLAYTIPFADLLSESVYQSGLFISTPSKMEEYPKLRSIFHGEETVSHIRSSIVHTIEHLAVHQIIVLVCLLCMAITINSRARLACMALLEKTSPYFPPFMGVSSSEIVLLQLQCSLIRVLESKWVWNDFVSGGSLLDKMWAPFVFAILAPVEIRFKIYLERKLHHLAPMALGVLHAASTVIFPIVYFGYLKYFSELRSFDPTDSSTDSLSILSSIQFFNVPGQSSHISITPISMFSHHYLILNGDISRHYTEVCSQLLFESYIFNNSLYNSLAPFAKNSIFACFVILLDRKFLKSICSREIHHICAHLIFEEFLNVGFCRYLLTPFNNFEKGLAIDHDLKIASLPNKVKIVHDALKWQLHEHKNIHPSPFFQLFNSDSNLLERFGNILSN